MYPRTAHGIRMTSALKSAKSFAWRAVIVLNLAAAISVVGQWSWHQLGGAVWIIGYAGLVVMPILLWIRAEYGFLLFYVLTNYLLAFLFSDSWRLTWADAPLYAARSTINIAITFAAGAILVALFKRLNNRRARSDNQPDREAERVRGDVAGGERPTPG